MDTLEKLRKYNLRIDAKQREDVLTLTLENSRIRSALDDAMCALDRIAENRRGYTLESIQDHAKQAADRANLALNPAAKREAS